MTGESADEERSRRIRRAGIAGGVIGATVGGVVMGVESLNVVAGGFPWWTVAPLAVAATVAGAWGGVRLGREHRVRADALDPGETVLNAYGVWCDPAPSPGQSANPEYAPYRLHLTTRRLMFWKGTDLLWSHGYGEVRLEACQAWLLVHHGGQILASVTSPNHPEQPDEVRWFADRIAARFGRSGTTGDG